MVFDLNDKLTYGKHKGEPLDHVIWKEPQYIEWCLNNISWFKISKKAKRKLEYTLDAYYGVVEEAYQELGLSWADFQ